MLCNAGTAAYVGRISERQSGGTPTPAAAIGASAGAGRHWAAAYVAAREEAGLAEYERVYQAAWNRAPCF